MTSGAAGKGARRGRGRQPGRAPRRDRHDWIDAARRALVAGGVDRVKVEPLSHDLGVTTGSFYHHFKNRQTLLDGLLSHWETNNNAAFEHALGLTSAGPEAQLDWLFDAWIQEELYAPDYDSAVRDWARVSPSVASAVRRVDNRRIAILQSIFEAMGYDAEPAMVRARITYFHQVGYQTLKVDESRARRLKLRDLYKDVLVGDVQRRR